MQAFIFAAEDKCGDAEARRRGTAVPIGRAHEESEAMIRQLLAEDR